MTNEEYKREQMYQLAMYYTRLMLEQNIITKQDYEAIDTDMRAEFSPIIGSLMLPK